MVRKYLASALLALPFLLNAQEPTNIVTATQTRTIIIVNDLNSQPAHEADAMTKDEAATSHLTWGVAAGGTIDLSGQDLTSIDISAGFGYKNDFIKFLGIGATIKTMTTTSSHAYPVYAMFRSGFSSRPTLCFLELRCGCTFLNLEGAPTQTDIYAGAALGITLAKGKHFASHISIGYEFSPVKDYTSPDGLYVNMKPMQTAALKIGIQF